MAIIKIPLTDVNCPYVQESSTPQLTIAAGTEMAVSPAQNVINMGGRTVLLVFNNTNIAARTVTIFSSVDPFGRFANITAFSIPAGEIAYRFFTAVGWEQSLGAGDLIVTASDVDVFLTAIPLNC